MEMTATDFELALLNLMHQQYQTSMKSKYGELVSGAIYSWAHEVPDLDTIIVEGTQMVELLRDLRVDGDGCLFSRRDDLAPGTIVNYFRLTLWPEVYWAFLLLPGGFSSDVGFYNDKSIVEEFRDPGLVCPGLWTFAALKSLAGSFSLEDGWDERITWSFSFGSRRFEGLFIFGLLMEWRETTWEC